MLRVRIGLWGILLSICVAIYALIGFWNFLTDSTNVNTYISTGVLDTTFANRVYSNSTNRLVYSQSSKNESSILIEEDSSVKNSSKYTVYSDYLYTPIVGFVRDNVEDYADSFVDLGNESYKINLYDVLMGLKNDKEWKDLNFHEKVLTGKIQIVIPSENTPYYSYIRDLFAYILTNKSVLEESDYVLTDSILDKCIKVSDISVRMKSDMDSKDFDEEHRSYFYIAPEFICMNRDSELYDMNSKYGDAYIPIYFDKTTKLTLDVSIANDVQDVDLIKDFITYNKDDYGFTKVSGWRVTDGYMSRSHFANYVNCV